MSPLQRSSSSEFIPIILDKGPDSFNTEEFRQVTAVTNSTVSFGQIPREDWFQPDWIDEEKAKAGRDALTRQGIIYGGGSLLRGISCSSPQSLIFLQIVYRTRFQVSIGSPKPLTILSGTETCVGSNRGRFTSKS